MGKKPVQAKFRPGARLNERSRLGMGKRLQAGVCRWCRCRDDDACPQGCGWLDQGHTLCTACEGVEQAWNALEVQRLPNMVRAFFRGFLVGSEDERGAVSLKNPYSGGTGQTWRYWEHGYSAGKKDLEG